MTLGDSLYRESVAAAQEALEDWAEKVKTDAIANMPIGDPQEDPNPAVALAESGRTTTEEPGRSVVLSFTTPYAARQELNQRLDHPRGGDSGYLERALLDNFREGERLIASKVRGRTKAR